MNNRLIATMLMAAALVQAEELFRYPVFREKLLRDERGELQIDDGGVSYKPADGKNSILIPLADVREADVSDPRIIRIETYDILKRNLAGRSAYVFRLAEGRHDQALARFLAAHLSRPVVGGYDPPPDQPFEIAAYHRHRFGGCHGKLVIGADAIHFVSDKSGESRTWPYRNIETIGSMNPFHFRVATLAETYNMDLKDRLREQAYNWAWRHVYRPLEKAAQ